MVLYLDTVQYSLLRGWGRIFLSGYTVFFIRNLGPKQVHSFFYKEFGSETSTQFLMKTAFLSNELSFKEKLLFSFLILTVRSLHFFIRNLGP